LSIIALSVNICMRNTAPTAHTSILISLRVLRVFHVKKRLKTAAAIKGRKKRKNFFPTNGTTFALLKNKNMSAIMRQRRKMFSIQNLAIIK